MRLMRILKLENEGVQLKALAPQATYIVIFLNFLSIVYINNALTRSEENAYALLQQRQTVFMSMYGDTNNIYLHD